MQFMRTAVLLAAMTALFLVVGAVLGGRGGMMIALVFAIGTNLFAYWNSDRMALSAVDAREVDYAARPISSDSSAICRAAPACRCRVSSLSTARSRMPSQRAAIRRTPRSL